MWRTASTEKEIIQTVNESGEKQAGLSEPALKCVDLAKIWGGPGAAVVAIEQLSFEVSGGEILAIIGPSGCGKTTTLQMLAGLEPPTCGGIFLNGSPVTEPSPDCILLSQDPPLFPWRTAQQNVEFPLQLRGVGKKARSSKAKEIIQQVGLTDFADAFPHQLSTGMQQRIALACSLVVDPQVVLMDEPFGALDAQTRFLMQQFLLQIWQRTPKTIVLVTHQIDEALFLADRILVMAKRPERIKKEIVVELERPRERFSPEFTILRKEIYDLLSEEVQFK